MINFIYSFFLSCKCSLFLSLFLFKKNVWQVNFSEGGPGSNSTGSEVASMSSQLPDTPNSMVASPIEAWGTVLAMLWSLSLFAPCWREWESYHVRGLKTMFRKRKNEWKKIFNTTLFMNLSKDNSMNCLGSFFVCFVLFFYFSFCNDKVATLWRQSWDLTRKKIFKEQRKMLF